MIWQTLTLMFLYVYSLISSNMMLDVPGGLGVVHGGFLEDLWLVHYTRLKTK